MLTSHDHLFAFAILPVSFLDLVVLVTNFSDQSRGTPGIASFLVIQLFVCLPFRYAIDCLLARAVAQIASKPVTCYGISVLTNSRITCYNPRQHS